jgi:hypothetical protein
VIEKNRIVKIQNVGSPSLPINAARRPALKEGGKEINCEGMYAMPGLIDMHGHIGGKEQGTPAEYVFKLWMAHGITTIRDPSAGNGLSGVLVHKTKSLENTITAPRIFAYTAFGQGSKTPITKSYKQFKAIIATMQSLPIDLPLIPGTIFELFIHGEEVQCIMSQVYDYKSINTEIVKKPKYIPPSCTATVLINIIDRAISMELFTTCQSLGRFVLRAKGKTCCIGVISKLMA